MARRPGLGRGLDALIPGGDQGSPFQAQKNSVLQIPVHKIIPNPRQPRNVINEQELEELSTSIKQHGIIQPLIVSPSDTADKYILIAGERRWRAAQLANLETVPAIVRVTNEKQKLELALIENIQREDLNALERAKAYEILVQEFSFTHDELAVSIGKSRSTITNTLCLLNLTQKGQTALLDGFISEGHARAVLALGTARAQDAALETILKMSLNVRQSELLVNKLSGKKGQKQIPSTKSPHVLELEDQLRTFFKTRVNLNPGKEGGTITIFYYSDEELNAIMDRLLKQE